MKTFRSNHPLATTLEMLSKDEPVALWMSPARSIHQRRGTDHPCKWLNSLSTCVFETNLWLSDGFPIEPSSVPYGCCTFGRSMASNLPVRFVDDEPDFTTSSMRGQPIVLDWLSLVWWPGLCDIPPPGVLRFPYFSGDWARPRISGFLHRVWTLCSPVFSTPRHQPSDGPVFGFASFCAAFRPLMASSSTTSTPIQDTAFQQFLHDVHHAYSPSGYVNYTANFDPKPRAYAIPQSGKPCSNWRFSTTGTVLSLRQLGPTLMVWNFPLKISTATKWWWTICSKVTSTLLLHDSMSKLLHPRKCLNHQLWPGLPALRDESRRLLRRLKFADVNLAHDQEHHHQPSANLGRIQKSKSFVTSRTTRNPSTPGKSLPASSHAPNKMWGTSGTRSNAHQDELISKFLLHNLFRFPLSRRKKTALFDVDSLSFLFVLLFSPVDLLDIIVTMIAPSPIY